MFSNLSSNSISLATVTPSLVIRGAPNPLSNTTFRPFGPSVTFTAAARMSMPRSIFARASTENFMTLSDIDASPTCPVGGNPSAERPLDEAGSVPEALSLRLVVAIGPRGIPFLALPTREQHNVDRNDGEDHPERHDRFLTGEERRLKKADWVSEELCPRKRPAQASSLLITG